MTPRELTRAECLRQLGLTDPASPEAIRRAYRTLALQLHPDRCLQDPSANGRFAALTEAYAALKRMGALTVPVVADSPRVMPHQIWTPASVHIRSATTAWWRKRLWMTLILLVAGAAWCGHDGYLRYPAAYRDWAASTFGDPSVAPPLNPRLESSALHQIASALVDRPVTFPEFLALHEQYLGTAGYQRGQEYWWVGPTMYLKLDPTIAPKPEAGRATGRQRLPWFEIGPPAPRPDEGRLRRSQISALLLLGLAVFVGLRLARVMTTWIQLDDHGLHYNRVSVSWEAMTGLQIKDYARKHWVDLQYTAGHAHRHLRLDRYHIEKFDEIIRTICARKGFASPLPAAHQPTRRD